MKLTPIIHLFLLSTVEAACSMAQMNLSPTFDCTDTDGITKVAQYSETSCQWKDRTTYDFAYSTLISVTPDILQLSTIYAIAGQSRNTISIRNPYQYMTDFKNNDVNKFTCTFGTTLAMGCLKYEDGVNPFIVERTITIPVTRSCTYNSYADASNSGDCYQFQAMDPTYQKRYECYCMFDMNCVDSQLVWEYIDAKSGVTMSGTTYSGALLNIDVSYLRDPTDPNNQPKVRLKDPLSGLFKDFVILIETKLPATYTYPTTQLSYDFNSTISPNDWVTLPKTLDDFISSTTYPSSEYSFSFKEEVSYMSNSWSTALTDVRRTGNQIEIKTSSARACTRIKVNLQHPTASSFFKTIKFCHYDWCSFTLAQTGPLTLNFTTKQANLSDSFYINAVQVSHLYSHNCSNATYSMKWNSNNSVVTTEAIMAADNQNIKVYLKDGSKYWRFYHEIDYYTNNAVTPGQQVAKINLVVHVNCELDLVMTNSNLIIDKGLFYANSGTQTLFNVQTLYTYIKTFWLPAALNGCTLIFEDWVDEVATGWTLQTTSYLVRTNYPNLYLYTGARGPGQYNAKLLTKYDTFMGDNRWIESYQFYTFTLCAQQMLNPSPSFTLVNALLPNETITPKNLSSYFNATFDGLCLTYNILEVRGIELSGLVLAGETLSINSNKLQDFNVSIKVYLQEKISNQTHGPLQLNLLFCGDEEVSLNASVQNPVLLFFDLYNKSMNFSYKLSEMFNGTRYAASDIRSNCEGINYSILTGPEPSNLTANSFLGANLDTFYFNFSLNTYEENNVKTSWVLVGKSLFGSKYANFTLEVSLCGYELIETRSFFNKTIYIGDLPNIEYIDVTSFFTLSDVNCPIVNYQLQISGFQINLDDYVAISGPILEIRNSKDVPLTILYTIVAQSKGGVLGYKNCKLDVKPKPVYAPYFAEPLKVQVISQSEDSIKQLTQPLFIYTLPEITIPNASVPFNFAVSLPTLKCKCISITLLSSKAVLTVDQSLLTVLDGGSYKFKITLTSGNVSNVFQLELAINVKKSAVVQNLTLPMVDQQSQSNHTIKVTKRPVNLGPPIQVWIEDFSRNGNITLKFNKNLTVPSQILKYFNQTRHNMTRSLAATNVTQTEIRKIFNFSQVFDVKIQANGDYEHNMYDFILDLMDWTEREVIVLINFTHPEIISTGKFPDRIGCRITNSSWFSVNETGQVLENDHIWMTKNLPLQMPRGFSEESVANAASSTNTAMTILTFLQIIFQICLKGSLNELWSLYFALQMTCYLKIFQTRIPPSAEIFIAEFVKLIEFDVLNPKSLIKLINPEFDLAKWLQQYFTNVDLSIMSDYLAYMFIMGLFVIWLLIVMCFMLIPKCTRRIKSLLTSIWNRVFFNIIIRSILIGFMKVLVETGSYFLDILQNPQHYDTTKGMTQVSLISLIVLIVCVFYTFLRCKRGLLLDKSKCNSKEMASFNKRYSNLISTLAIYRNSTNLYFYPVFLTRRILFVSVAIWAWQFSFLQTQLTIFFNIFWTIWYGSSRPHDTALRFRVEIINEWFVLVCFYHLILFSKFVIDEEIKFYLGFSYVVSISLMIFFNLGLMLHNLVKKILNQKRTEAIVKNKVKFNKFLENQVIAKRKLVMDEILNKAYEKEIKKVDLKLVKLVSIKSRQAKARLATIRENAALEDGFVTSDQEEMKQADLGKEKPLANFKVDVVKTHWFQPPQLGLKQQSTAESDQKVSSKEHRVDLKAKSEVRFLTMSNQIQQETKAQQAKIKDKMMNDLMGILAEENRKFDLQIDEKFKNHGFEEMITGVKKVDVVQHSGKGDGEMVEKRSENKPLNQMANPLDYDFSQEFLRENERLQRLLMEDLKKLVNESPSDPNQQY